jgi:hypothetical protein
MIYGISFFFLNSFGYYGGGGNYGSGYGGGGSYGNTNGNYKQSWW